MAIQDKNGMIVVQSPRVSIIVPAYNAASSIRRCSEAIIRQTISEWELIIIDDGSSDNTYHTALQFAASDNRIRVFHQDNQGVSAARNFGISQSRGAKLCFVDADDTVEPDYLERLLSSDADLTVCGYTCDIRISHDRYTSRVHIPTKLNVKDSRFDALGDDFCNGLFHAVWNKIFDKSIITTSCIHFPPFPINEDFIFVMEYLLHCRSVHLLPDALYHWIRGEKETTGVDSLPDNILVAYETGHRLLREFYPNNKGLADRIAYYSYELVIDKIIRLRKGKSRRMHLNKIRQSQYVRDSFNEFSPSTPLTKFCHNLNRHGLYLTASRVNRLAGSVKRLIHK